MKKILAIMFLVSIMALAATQEARARTYDDRPIITVNGEAVVNVQPDKIVVTLGIETWDKEVTAAKKKNNDILKKAMEAIQKLGIPEKEINTDQLSIEPRYETDYGKRDFIGFFVRNTFTVTLIETSKLETLITAILQSGVNYFHGIDFQTTEFKKYREQARDLALKAAKEKAEKMAGALGQSIGAPLQISENYAGSPWGYYSSWFGWGHGRGQGMSQNVAQNVQGGSGENSETVAFGKISIRANVSVTFELAKKNPVQGD